MSIPPVNGKLLTRVDKQALDRMPENWFSESDIWPRISRPAYRCDRLHKLGYLDFQVVGEYPNLEGRYRKKFANAGDCGKCRIFVTDRCGECDRCAKCCRCGGKDGNKDAE